MAKRTQAQIRAAIRKRMAKSKKKAPQASTRVHNIGYSSGVTLWPSKFRAKLRYTASVAIAAGTVDVFNNVNWNMTSIYDSYVPAGGGNPKGYTDLKNHYAHYLVLGCKVTVDFLLRSGNAMVCTLSACEDTTHTNLVGKDDRMNDERTKYITLHNEQPRGKLTINYSKAKVYGNGKNSQLTAPFTDNPAENYYALIGTINYGAGLTQSIVDYTITLVYDVIVSEKLDTVNN